MEKKVPRRIVLKTKDIEIICKRSARTARRMMQQLKVIFERKKWQYVMIGEFCEYMGLEVDEFWDMVDKG